MERRENENLIEQWRRLDLDRGHREGHRESRVESLLDLIEARGLELDDAQRARIESCTDEQTLRVWLRRALTAEHPEDVFDVGASGG